MTTSAAVPFRSIAEQVAAARAGEYAQETEEERFLRFAGAAAVGRSVLEELAARLGVDEREALNELLSCLMVRGWELDEEARSVRAPGRAGSTPTFERALGVAAFRLRLACQVDESELDDHSSTPSL